MAVEENAVDRATMLITAPVTASDRSWALSARKAGPLLPYLAASVRMGELKPRPMTKVMTSWMPVIVVFRSLVAR